MTVLQTIAVAFAMFSAVPVPQFDWNEKNMRYSLCAFPLVGVLCGALWYVCASLPLPAMVRAAGFCLIPVWVTGGIHLDGYADTCDALCSYGDTQKKLDILKDPHCGAFAVIRLCSYFVAYFALCCCVQFTPQVGAVWLLALVLERACSGYAVAAFPLAKNTGLAHTFATAADRTTVRRVLGCLSIVLAVALFALGGGVLVLAAGLPCGATTVWRSSSLAVLPGTWPGGFCKKRNCICWRPLCFASGRGFCNMLFITGPLYSGKRTFAKPFGGRQIYEVQTLAANAESLPALADELAQYDVVTATEVGGGVVPIDPSSAPRGKPPAALPACWLSGPTVWCRYSAACPPC